MIDGNHTFASSASWLPQKLFLGGLPWGWGYQALKAERLHHLFHLFFFSSADLSQNQLVLLLGKISLCSYTTVQPGPLYFYTFQVLFVVTLLYILTNDTKWLCPHMHIFIYSQSHLLGCDNNLKCLKRWKMIWWSVALCACSELVCVSKWMCVWVSIQARLTLRWLAASLW